MISIVLPVYNAKKYIRKALDSIMAQSYKNFELIIIDDGANDGTGEICKEYERNYQNVRYIRQLNSGVCAARNRGILEAKGEYITFCDHDDEYEVAYLEKLFVFASENDLDMAKCGAKFIDIDRAERIHSVHVETFEEKIADKEDLIRSFFKLPDSYFDVWNGIYKTSLLQKSGLKFDETLIYGMEDYDFNTKIISFVKKIGYLNECLYVHYLRMNQSTSGKFKEDRIYDIVKYQNVTYDLLKEYMLILEKDWEAISFGKNLIGVVKYSVRGRVGRKKTVEYIKFYTNQLESHLDFIKWINLKYKKYTFLAMLSKYKMYNSIYYVWLIKYCIKEFVLTVRRSNLL